MSATQPKPTDTEIAEYLARQAVAAEKTARNTGQISTVLMIPLALAAALLAIWLVCQLLIALFA